LLAVVCVQAMFRYTHTHAHTLTHSHTRTHTHTALNDAQLNDVQNAMLSMMAQLKTEVLKVKG